MQGSVSRRKVKRAKRRPGLWLILLIAVVSAAVAFAVIGVYLKYSRLEREVESAVPEHRIGAFYYNHLTKKQQNLYDAMAAAALEFKEETEVLPYSFTEEEFKLAVEYLRADRQDLFYCDFGAFSLRGERSVSGVTLAYHTTKDEAEEMVRKLDSAVDAILADIAESKPEGEFALELLLHDRLVGGCKPTLEGDFTISTPYGALVAGEADALGYAGALKLLFDASDIYSLLVFGEAGGLDHVWNMAYIDDKFYHLDASWNDAELDFALDIPFHGYFNLSSAVIASDHTLRDPDILPEAVDDTDYYRAMGLSPSNKMELDRIVYREILSAGYTGDEFIELSPEFTDDGEELRDVVVAVIGRINSVQEDFSFREIFRAYNAADGRNAMTIQLYYEKKYSSYLPEDEENTEGNEND